MKTREKLGEPIVAVQLVLTLSQREYEKLQAQAKRAGMTFATYVQAIVQRQAR